MRKLCHWPASRALLVVVTALVAYMSLPSGTDASDVFLIEPGQDAIGRPHYAYPFTRDTLLDIARDYDVGYNEITAANPDVDPWLPEAGAKVLVPTVWLLPSARREGIVLNLAEMRLYYFYSRGGADMVVTYPIGVGREGFDTPLGVYEVTGKEKNPTWRPPESIRAEKPELPESVPPGPDNPLGEYKLTLNIPGYLIHGTNRPLGVGRRVSHGCIRLYPEDIMRLYNRVPVGARVEVVYQPVKVGLLDGRLAVEVHEDYLGKAHMLREALSEIERRGLTGLIDPEALEKALQEKRGVPVVVSE